MNEAEFLKLWQDAAPERRFHYVVNGALVAALVLAVAVGWIGLGALSMASWAPLPLLLTLGGLLGLVSVAVTLVGVRVRLKGRASGVVAHAGGVAWKLGAEVGAVSWDEVQPEGVAFVTGGRGGLSGEIQIQTASGERRIPMFGPFMRLYALEAFLEVVLKALARGREGGGRTDERRGKKKQAGARGGA